MAKRSKRSYSLVEFMRRLMLFAIPVVVINIFIGIVSIINIRQQNQAAINSSLSLFQTETATKIYAIEHFVLWTAVEEPLVDDLKSAENVSDLGSAMTTLRTRVNDSQYGTGSEYQYFAYLEEQDTFFNASRMQIPYSDYVAIRSHIRDQVKAGTIRDSNLTWQTLTTDKTTYLYYLISYRDFTFATFVSAQELVQPLSQLNLGKRGYLEITDLNDQSLYLSNPDVSASAKRASSLFYSQQSYEGKAHALPFNLYLYSDNFSNYGTLLISQIVIVLSALLLCTIFAGFIFGMYYKVIRPIEQFSYTLSNLDMQDELINLEDNNIRELEQASIQFKNLIREIKRLRIDIYEKELEQKRFEIVFLQNQIRPHFYLNCLTTIGSMAQLRDYKSIESMVLFTSHYFRYLFQTDRDMVPLEYELAHIQAYLDIQSLRYGPVFTYECHVDKEDTQALVLPLLLITFIENAIKHGMTRDKPLQLSLIVVRKKTADGTYLQIDISDSGHGFPQSILDKIEQGEKIGEELSSHIGITNSIQRLSLVYGTNYEIDFFNDPNGGAHIRLVIPLQTKED